jgi:hypothetical protein
MPNELDNISGKAIYCDCYISEFKRYKILGSITDQGVIEILRGHRNKTIIQTTELLISCPQCNYQKLINLSKVVIQNESGN